MGLFVELGFDLVAGVAGAGHSLGTLFGVGATALDHETLENAVKCGAVVETFAGEFFEILDVLRCDVGPEGEGHFSEGGLDDGVFGRCGSAHGSRSEPVALGCRKNQFARRVRPAHLQKCAA